MSDWDHATDTRFYDYYRAASLSVSTIRRIYSIRDVVLRVAQTDRSARRPLKVADIGCGAGTQSIMWAEVGHRVYGLDVNEPLLHLARERAVQTGYPIDFQVGSASKLPWPDGSMDVCLALELLEHVADWRTCLSEFSRILGPRGILFLTTTNKLCPVQQEFRLPMYSWYPGALKHYFERLAVGRRPDLVNFAKYPAVNWFTYYGLREELVARGFGTFDRFDLMDLSKKGPFGRAAVLSIRALPPLKWLAHVATSGTTVLAIKGENGQ